MKVKAIKTGFYGGELRHHGEEFEIDGKHQLGSWMQQIRKKPGPKPKALDEINEVVEKQTED